MKAKASGCVVENGYLLCKECGSNVHKTIYDAQNWRRREIKKQCCECGNILRLIIEKKLQPAASRREV